MNSHGAVLTPDPPSFATDIPQADARCNVPRCKPRRATCGEAFPPATSHRPPQWYGLPASLLPLDIDSPQSVIAGRSHNVSILQEISSVPRWLLWSRTQPSCVHSVHRSLVCIQRHTSHAADDCPVFRDGRLHGRGVAHRVGSVRSMWPPKSSQAPVSRAAGDFPLTTELRTIVLARPLFFPVRTSTNNLPLAWPRLDRPRP